MGESGEGAEVAERTCQNCGETWTHHEYDYECFCDNPRVTRTDPLVLLAERYYAEKHAEWEERKAERAHVREGIKPTRLGWHTLRRWHRVRYRVIKAWKRGTYR